MKLDKNMNLKLDAAQIRKLESAAELCEAVAKSFAEQFPTAKAAAEALRKMLPQQELTK